MLPLDHQRLGIAEQAAAHGGVAGVPYGEFAGKRVEIPFAEDLGHQAHFGVDTNVLAVGGSDSGAFLAAVL